ncbi:class F sortase [Streptomyces mirabilis]|uniref:class F sortase n=1 Tax=Streptomyces mirabilis TaxID=68239 RepID=UPI00367EF8A5
MFASEVADEEERQKKRAPWGVIALVLLTGLALIRNGSGEFDVGPPQPATAAAADSRTPVATFSNGPAALPYSVVDRVRIPAIQVDAPVVPVGLDSAGWVDAPPPDNANLAGWFTGAVSPGEKGTAVIVGHVDNMRGPAVFYGLGSLKKGNRVEVQRKDGKTATFEIYGVDVFAKNNFPGDRVYGSKGTPELRVITCGGGFSKQHGYDGNVVVFARLVEVR